MAAYLGKISAVISANTQDFTRAMGNTRREIDAFENNVKKKLQGFRLNLEMGSFDKTLTKLQLFQRTVQEAARFRIDTTSLERMFEVFEDVGKPLIAVKNDVEKLTNSVQAQLYPALGQVQAGFQGIQRSIQEGLDVPQSTIDNLLDCLAKLRASVAVVKDIEGLTTKLLPEVSGATFVQPHAVDELKRSANLRDRASRMSADIRAEPVWQQTNVTVGSLASRINTTAAAVEKYKLELASADKWMAAATTQAERLSAAWLQAQAAEGLAIEQERLDGQLSRLRQINDLTERRLRLEEETARQTKMFLSASGGAGDKLDPILEGAASDFMTARQFRGNFGADNVTGRLNVTRRIQDAEDRITSLIRQRHEIEQDSLLTNKQMAIALDANRQEIEKETDSLLRYTAAQSGGSASEDQVLAAAKRRRKNTGSMGMGRFGNLDLAFQQGMFAIDDLMSATGELEYKLRAVSNNITQLGLMLGQSGLIRGLTATKGLFLGLAFVIGAELGIAIYRWVSGSQKAKDRLDAMNSAVATQRQAVEKLAQAYDKLSQSIGQVGMSEARKKRQSRESEIQEVKAASNEVQRANIALRSPDIIEARARTKGLEDKLQNSTRNWWFLETETMFQSRRKGLMAGIEASKRLEDRLIASRSGDSISDKEATNALFGERAGGKRIPLGIASAGGAAYAKFFLDSLDALAAKGVAAGGRRGLASGLIAQREFLEGQKQKVAARGDLGTWTKNNLLDLFDKELGRVGDALRRFADLAYEDEVVLEKMTRQMFSTADAMNRAGDLLSGAFGGKRAASRIQSDIDDLAQAIEQIEAMAADASAKNEDPARFRADSNAAKDMAANLEAAANFVAHFARVLDRVTRSIEQDASSLESRAEEKRRLALRLDGIDGGAAAARAAGAAADARGGRLMKQRIEDDIAGAIEQAEAGAAPASLLLRKRIAEIDSQLAVPANTVGENGVFGGTLADRQRMRRERTDALAGLERGIERDPAVVAARKRADEFTAQAEMKAAADRGRILGLSPQAKAREEMDSKIADIGAMADELKGDEKFDFVRQAMSNMAKEVAPLFAQFGEEVRNAQLGGPSRAALNASDVTTMQGQSELQRLLRKDDPSQDINFVEAQKQTELLRTLPQRLAEATGIVLDFK